MATAADDALVRKKRELLRELEKLRREAAKAERECRLQSFHRKEELESLERESKQLAGERDKELQNMSRQLTATKLNVKNFKDTVKTRNPSPAFLNDVKVKMLEIETSISSFKSKQKTVYDELVRSELQCFNEISSLEKKMSSWERNASSVVGGGSRGASSRGETSGPDIASDLPPAVAAFEKFQRQTGGSCGGWNEEDHAIFLRVRQKHRGRTPDFIDEALPLLAPRSVDDLREHEIWFQEFSHVLEAKRKAIEEWKDKRTLQRKEDCNSYRETEIKDEAEARQRELMRRKAEERERIKREAELAAWKVRKEIEKIRDQEELLKKRLEEKKKEEAERIRKAELKAKAEEFSKARDEAERVGKEKEERRQREERACRQKTAAEEILKFQERDQMTVAQRIVFNKAQAVQAVEKEERLKKLKGTVVVAERDPERLVRPTQAQKERNKTREEEDAARQEGVRNRANINIHQVSHRGTPSWRAGI